MYGLELAVQTAPLSRSPALTWVSALTTSGTAVNNEKPMTEAIATDNAYLAREKDDFVLIMIVNELIMPTGYQRGDKETLKKL
jgi:hypothetical protein